MTWVCRECTLENVVGKKEFLACGMLKPGICETCSHELSNVLCVDASCSACEWHEPRRPGRASRLRAHFRVRGVLVEFRWGEGGEEEYFLAAIKVQNSESNYTVSGVNAKSVWTVHDVPAEDIRPRMEEPVVDVCPTGCEREADFLVDVDPANETLGWGK